MACGGQYHDLARCEGTRLLVSLLLLMGDTVTDLIEEPPPPKERPSDISGAGKLGGRHLKLAIVAVLDSGSLGSWKERQ